MDLDYPNTFLHLTLHNVMKLWYLFHMSIVEASKSLVADTSAIKKITSAQIRTFFRKPPYGTPAITWRTILNSTTLMDLDYPNTFLHLALHIVLKLWYLFHKSNVEASNSSEADTSAIKLISSAQIRIFCKKASFRNDVIRVTTILSSTALMDLEYPNTFLHLTLHNVLKLWYLLIWVM